VIHCDVCQKPGAKCGCHIEESIWPGWKDRQRIAAAILDIGGARHAVMRWVSVDYAYRVGWRSYGRRMGYL
jgi:hypothetical protein